MGQPNTASHFKLIANRHTSKQNYNTPKVFIDAVVKRFGPLAFDLAASPDNAQADAYFTAEDNSLLQDWSQLRGNLWLNPPFNQAAAFLAKCAATPTGVERRIIVLLPANVGTNYFAEHAVNRCRVIAIRPRIHFEGMKQCFPRDLMLLVYGDVPELECWRWK